MSRWKLGSKVNKWAIPPTKTPFTGRWNNPLILTIDPNFRVDIQVPLHGEKTPWKKNQRCNLSLHFRDKSGFVHKDPIVCKLVTIPGLYLVVKLLEKHHGWALLGTYDVTVLYWFVIKLMYIHDPYRENSNPSWAHLHINKHHAVLYGICPFCLLCIGSLYLTGLAFQKSLQISALGEGLCSTVCGCMDIPYAPCCVFPPVLHPPKWSTGKKSWR